MLVCGNGGVPGTSYFALEFEASLLSTIRTSTTLELLILLQNMGLVCHLPQERLPHQGYGGPHPATSVEHDVQRNDEEKKMSPDNSLVHSYSTPFFL